MLQSINDKSKGWVAYLIVGVIAVPFALVGISSYLGGSEGLVAAKVNGEEILVQEVQGVVLQQRQRLSQMFGGQLPPSMNQEIIVNQALDQVVNEVLLRQESENNGYRASNQEVYDAISIDPTFHKDGQFDAQTYEQLLTSNRRNKTDYESQVRDRISNQQFTRAVATAAFLPQNQLAGYQSIQNQTRDVETFTLKTGDYESEVSVSEDEIKTEFDANLESYMTNEKVKLNYVLLKQDDIADNLTAEDDAIQAFYQENESRYIEPEKRKVAQILVKIDDNKEEAQTKAQALYDQIQSGEKTFEELAVSSSDDEEASKNNGEIGLVSQGERGVLFDAIAFAPTLQKDAMTEVVETEDGFAILKILDVVASAAKPFEEVKTEVEALYRQEKAENLFIEQSDRLQTLAFENDSGLEEAADAIGSEVVTSDWIERNVRPNGDDPLLSPNVVAAAFSDEVLGTSKNSEMIEIDAKNVIVVRVQEHELPKQKELASVQDDIEKLLSAKKLNELLVEKGDAALKTLSESGLWTELESIGATGEEIKKSEAIKRDDSSLPRNVINKIFSMQKPDSGNTFAKAVLANGDNVLISLSKVTNDESEADESLQQRYTQSIAQREQAALLASLREKAEIELFAENIQ